MRFRKRDYLVVYSVYGDFDFSEEKNNWTYFDKIDSFTGAVYIFSNLGAIKKINGSHIFLVGELFVEDNLLLRICSFSGEKDRLRLLANLDGYFCLFLVDSEGSLEVVTDRLHSQKVMVHSSANNRFFSNNLYCIARFQLKGIDRGSVVEYVLNGMIGGSRTLLSDVCILDPAMIYSLRNNCLESELYWDAYDKFSIPVDPIHEVSEAKSELGRVINNSVRECISGVNEVGISLSGGFDASALLGYATRYHSNVTSYTYYNQGSINDEKSDYSVAKKQANQQSSKFVAVSAQSRDVINIIKQNARTGQALSDFSDEIDFWEYFEKFDTQRMLLYGEECFGIRNSRYIRKKDILRVFKLYNVHHAPLLSKSLSTSLKLEVFNQIYMDEKALMERIDIIKDKYRQLNFLYFDIRIRKVLMNWRQYHAGKSTIVRLPYLRNEVLEFALLLKNDFLFSKRLFIQLVKEVFPKMFSIPRANSNGESMLRIKISNGEVDFQELFELKSSIDEYLNPSTFQLWLASSRAKKLSKLRTRLSKLNRKIMKVSPFYLSHRFFFSVDDYDIVKRYLMMRVLIHDLEEIDKKI